MTLNVTPTEIQIKNASGQIKFTSNNRLIYQKGYYTGTVGCGPGYGNELTIGSFIGLGVNDFIISTINIQSCTGAVGQALLGLDIPANGTIITEYYGRAENNEGRADQDMMCFSIVDGYRTVRGYKLDYLGSLLDTTITTVFSYKIFIYSYL